jgi:hypothetical protein
MRQRKTDTMSIFIHKPTDILALLGPWPYRLGYHEANICKTGRLALLEHLRLTLS